MIEILAVAELFVIVALAAWVRTIAKRAGTTDRLQDVVVDRLNGLERRVTDICDDIEGRSGFAFLHSSRVAREAWVRSHLGETRAELEKRVDALAEAVGAVYTGPTTTPAKYIAKGGKR